VSSLSGVRDGAPAENVFQSILTPQKPHLMTSNLVFLQCEKNKHYNLGPPRFTPPHCGVCGVSSYATAVY